MQSNDSNTESGHKPMKAYHDNIMHPAFFSIISEQKNIPNWSFGTNGGHHQKNDYSHVPFHLTLQIFDHSEATDKTKTYKFQNVVGKFMQSALNHYLITELLESGEYMCPNKNAVNIQIPNLSNNLLDWRVRLSDPVIDQMKHMDKWSQTHCE